jgi:hypothetical protein
MLELSCSKQKRLKAEATWSSTLCSDNDFTLNL